MPRRSPGPSSDEPALLEDVLDGLFLIAAADGAIHEAEHAYLRCRRRRSSASPAADFARIEARHARRPDDPYLVLGANREMGDAELKRHLSPPRRRQPIPTARSRAACPRRPSRSPTRRSRAINAAWDLIRKERRARGSALPA